MKRSLIIVVLLAVIFAAAASAVVTTSIQKKLARDPVSFEITNDDRQKGNTIETYHVPVGNDGATVFCIVYSDREPVGVGGGIDCDFTRGR